MLTYLWLSFVVLCMAIIWALPTACARAMLGRRWRGWMALLYPVWPLLLIVWMLAAMVLDAWQDGEED